MAIEGGCAAGGRGDDDDRPVSYILLLAEVELPAAVLEHGHVVGALAESHLGERARGLPPRYTSVRFTSTIVRSFLHLFLTAQKKQILSLVT